MIIICGKWFIHMRSSYEIMTVQLSWTALFKLIYNNVWNNSIIRTNIKSYKILIFNYSYVIKRDEYIFSYNFVEKNLKQIDKNFYEKNISNYE